jgi:hypothetical protein
VNKVIAMTIEKHIQLTGKACFRAESASEATPQATDPIQAFVNRRNTHGCPIGHTVFPEPTVNMQGIEAVLEE